VPYDESGWPMDKRVGQHASVSLEIINQFSKKNSERALVIQNAPRYKDIVRDGVGSYFHDPKTMDPSRVYHDR